MLNTNCWCSTGQANYTRVTSEFTLIQSHFNEVAIEDAAVFSRFDGPVFIDVIVNTTLGQRGALKGVHCVLGALVLDHVSINIDLGNISQISHGQIVTWSETDKGETQQICVFFQIGHVDIVVQGTLV